MNYGWICPVCGKGLAPWTLECNCINANYILTCASTRPVKCSKCGVEVMPNTIHRCGSGDIKSNADQTGADNATS